MDVIYPYLGTRDDFELRYSLRSLVNVPHSRVIVAGDRPQITNHNVEHVGVGRISDRYQSSTTNIVQAIQRAEVTGEFVVMHDDIFVLQPWTYRHEHRGTVVDYLNSGAPNGGYRQALQITCALLRLHGVKDPLFFGMHTPAVYDAGRFANLAREFKGKRFLMRTLYFNLFPQPSERREDVKLKQWGGDAPADVLSISDAVGNAPQFREWIAARFPEPSEYERPPDEEDDDCGQGDDLRHPPASAGR